MSAKKKFKTVNEYIESQPEDTKRTLLALRAIILKAVPDATELFNYDIPAYALVKGGKRDKQIMIAGYKTFAGFYTGTGILQHFSKELAGYKVAKASVQFPNNRPLPKTLIVEIIKFKKKTSTDSSKS
ncbi:MAG: iron chaperone [Pyrinomonadaceae bacterium]